MLHHEQPAPRHGGAVGRQVLQEEPSAHLPRPQGDLPTSAFQTVLLNAAASEDLTEQSCARYAQQHGQTSCGMNCLPMLLCVASSRLLCQALASCCILDMDCATLPLLLMHSFASAELGCQATHNDCAWCMLSPRGTSLQCHLLDLCEDVVGGAQDAEWHLTNETKDIYPDFVKMAESFSVPAKRVLRPEELRPAIR